MAYLLALLKLIIVRNNQNRTRKNPAAKVKGSPMKGTHENNKVQTPKWLNHLDNFCGRLLDTGNHFWVCQRIKNRPNNQLITLPKIFPALPKRKSVQTLSISIPARVTSRASDENGKRVAASSELKNSIKYTSSIKCEKRKVNGQVLAQSNRFLFCS